MSTLTNIEYTGGSLNGIKHPWQPDWIQTKEDHSNNIQNILCDYFLIQRVKKSKTNYTEQLTLIHQILISAMKCKQTLENKHIENGINHLNLFSKAYLDKHGIEHLQKLRN